MHISRWLFVVLLIVAAVVGAGGVLVSVAANRYTSTDAFCTSSCHSMTLQIADPYFQRSKHLSNNEGVRPSCGDCHIPRNNWFIETYTGVTLGIRDLFVELTHNFGNPGAWEAYRVGLEQKTVAQLRAWDSTPCRSCHDASAIHPKSEAGPQSHAALAQGGATCVDCHVNLVHPAPASATQSDVPPASGSK